jgi:threonine-phosphate decarboxylase
MINGHGSDIHNYNQHVVADFSSSIWYAGLAKGLEDHLKQHMGSIVHYPDPDAHGLCEKIARHHQIKPEQVLVTNGATDAFYMLAHQSKGAKTTILYPCFSEYEDACKRYHHHISYIPSNEFSDEMSFHSRFVWIGNPNNPDGQIKSLRSLIKLSSLNPDIQFIIDEAFLELSTQGESLIPYVLQHKNLIIVRSLTKSFAIPGVRLGYLVAEPSVCKALKKHIIPWNVNSLALEAGHFIFDHYDELKPEKQEIANRCELFYSQLQNIPEVNVYPSSCNFFLVKMNEGSAGELKIYLLNKYQLLIRDASNFRGLDSSYFRVAVQNEKYNEILIKGIKEFITTR